MITSTLRRAGLVLAVIASFSIRAAAQTDAAFASALGKMPAGLATMAQLKTQSQVPAAPSDPGATKNAWLTVVYHACISGEVESANSEFTCTLNFGDPATKHGIQAKIIGRYTYSGGKPGAIVYGGVIFDFTIKYVPETGQWRRDLCIFRVLSSKADQSPVLTNAVCSTSMSPTDEEFAKGPDEKLDLSDPKTAARFDAILKLLADRYR